MVPIPRKFISQRQRAAHIKPSIVKHDKCYYSSMNKVLREHGGEHDKLCLVGLGQSFSTELAFELGLKE